MATKYGLAIAAPFVKGTAGSTIETMRRNYNKDNLIQVASSLGWLVRDTLGVDVFKACLNLVESSPACGGGMERLAKAFQLNRLGPYREGALNAAKMSSEDYVAHMAKHGLNSYGEPLEDDEEAAAAAAALAASSQRQQQLHTQEGDSTLFSQNPPVMSLFDTDGDADGGGGGNARKVSAPVANDDLDRVDDVDDPHDDVGNVRAPAATDPLLAGGTVGRIADQSQAQAGSQVRGPADNKKKICKAVWRDNLCMDWSCDRAHPPRCGDPMCYPTRRRDCQHWHRGGKKLLQEQQYSQRSRQPPQPRQQQGQQHRQQQGQQRQQGNARGAGPGRAGKRQTQGSVGGAGQRQRQQQRPPPPPHPQLQQPQRGGPPHPHRQWQHQRAPPAPPPPLFQQPGWPQQQQQMASYRDVAARGTPLSSSFPSHNGSGSSGGSGPLGSLGSVGFAPAQPNQALLSTVVASVMAVLAGRNQHFCV